MFGTWLVDEARKTKDMGYGLVDVFEFWEYEVKCIVRGTNSGGLFAEYVNMYLNLKEEDSGYPSWVQSEEDKDKYIEYCWRAKGIANGQCISFQKCESKDFGKTVIKFDEG